MIQADASSNAGGLLTLLEPILASIVPALLGAIGFWWKQRRDSHDRIQERHRVLIDVKDEIEAIGAWIRAYSLVAPAEPGSVIATRARNNLESAYERLEKSLQDNQSARQRTSVRSYLGIILIRRELRNSSARRARRYYYVSLGYAFGGNLLSAFLLFSPHANLTLLGWILFVMLFWLIFFAWPPIVFFTMTNRRDRETPTGHLGTPAMP